MDAQSNESAHHGYAAQLVPTDAQGSGWRIFFIVAGSLCGLPCFILSARVFRSLGVGEGLLAILVGAAISAMLGACSAFAGSRSRMGLAMLADDAFGPLGARVVKLVIAVSLVGWFGVGISVLGAAAAPAIGQLTGWDVPPLAIGLPVCIGIAAVTLFGATGLERLGNVIVPTTALVLGISVYLVAGRIGGIAAVKGSGEIDFAGAVSAIVGSYVVGIVIQPDYGRFVRRPVWAAVGAGTALGLAYPLIMILSSIASLALGTTQLISAMTILGFGLPALAVLLLGAWIDTSACLYSASLSLANQLPRFGFVTIVLFVTAIGIALVLAGADAVFVPFLVTLGIALPPLAAALILSSLWGRGTAQRKPAAAVIAWLFGSVIGLAAIRGALELTRMPTLDSILAAASAFGLVRLFEKRRTRTDPVPAEV